VLITDEAGHHRSTPVDLDLAAQFRQPERIIASTLDPTALGIDPRTYLDKALT
jgi:lambda repressor-like predicted transcriptional regulator